MVRLIPPASGEVTEAPTSGEITRVQRWFAAHLDEGMNCPCCDRWAKTQHRQLGVGPALWLLAACRLCELLAEVGFRGSDRAGAWVQTGTVIQVVGTATADLAELGAVSDEAEANAALPGGSRRRGRRKDGQRMKGTDATSILPLYDLIEELDGGRELRAPGSTQARTNGFWRPTARGRAFAAGAMRVPSHVVTRLSYPEAFEGRLISIREALDARFNYEEFMRRLPGVCGDLIGSRDSWATER